MGHRLRLTAIAAALIVALGAGRAQAFQTTPVTPAAAAFNQAVQLHDAGKFGDAIPLFKQAIALGFQPINQAHFRLARTYARMGNSELALAELEGLAAAGFANTSVLTMTDLDSVR